MQICAATTAARLRRSLMLSGVVQGVGFRPFVYTLARRLELTGFVQNRVGGVLIEVQGPPNALAEFQRRLRAEAPAAARIDGIDVQTLPLLAGCETFEIVASDASAGGAITLSPDLATCAECLAELFDPAQWRYQYPFTNCTQCGPRLTIIESAPYDRPRTTMASFAMCPQCQAEYDDPSDRRFHAEPNACPRCGPELKLTDRAGAPLAGDPVVAFAAALERGQIGALKSLGGYHLACLAGDAQAVAELRRRKQRDEKPLAVMVRDVEAATQLCHLTPAGIQALCSPARPIVLLRRRDDAPHDLVCAAVAPGNPELGVMLPYTPLHHLLLAALPRPLVMTSGNSSDEPIATEDQDAHERLGDIADVFLKHNRQIHVRCDDSVVRIMGEHVAPLRRARGYAPLPLSSPVAASVPILAVGGQLKATFALGTESQVVLSQHLGDLDCLSSYEAFVRDVGLYEQLFAQRPKLLVHDLHPDYASTHYARQRSSRENLATLAVQHHHAHLASCLAEHGISDPAIGVIFDGAGYGADGAIWGGEFLIGDLRAYRRFGHWRYVPMPGGERSIREPWRMAVSCLCDAGLDPALNLPGRPPREIAQMDQLLAKRALAPLTSSVGRLFDAVAALTGLRQSISYEGQAAMELEWRAAEAPGEGDADLPYPLAMTEEDGRTVVDSRLLVTAIAADTRAGVALPRIARRFHASVACASAEMCRRARNVSGLNRVALSGGVFANAMLTEMTTRRLVEQGFEVLSHRQVPPGDGGLAFGQWAVAAAQPSHSAR
jgi:hydrogenase maturation protein HypF